MSDELELKAEIDELTEKLSEYRQTIDGHNEELFVREGMGYDKAMLEIDSKIDHAFNAGYDSCCTGSEQLKGLLNYKMEQRL